MRMERVNQILQHTLYQSCRRQIDEKEKDRIFCGHDMGHLLDVARLAWIFNLEAKEVSSTDVGEIVMDELKELDEVAYVRFASVYREFKDVNPFMDEIKKMMLDRSKGDK